MSTESPEPAASSQQAPTAASETESKTEPRPPAADDPEKLLAAANAASGPARTAWLAFLGLVAYLLISLAGVTHVDLLLNSPVTLPIVNVEIPLFSFFLTAPFLFLLLHLGLLVQHAMLAHKYQHFSLAIAGSEEGQLGENPDRKLVHSYVFSQMLAAPRPPWVLHLLMRLMVFVTFSLMPVVVLLYFQVKFLPSHEVAITHAHRLAILLDLALLFIVRPFIAMPYLRPQGRKLRLGNPNWRWEMSYASLGLAGALCLVAASFSLLVATIPHGCFWPSGTRPEGRDSECFSLDRTTAGWWPVQVKSGTLSREVFGPTRWLFEGEVDLTSGAPESLFSRNLVVTDKDLVKQTQFEDGERSLQLRGRDLRFAGLDRSDLRHADLFGSDLRGASVFRTRLDFADLTRAQLQGAALVSAELKGANLTEARLQGADLRSAQLQGTNLIEAQLQRADLTFEAQLQGADLGRAELQGADLGGAKLQGADLRGAQLQGANLGWAELRGANLSHAQLQGADLSWAKLQGAWLEGAGIWETRPPILSDAKLVNPIGLVIEPPDDFRMRRLQELISRAGDESWPGSATKRLERLLDADRGQAWIDSAEATFWTNLSRQTPPEPNELADYLAELSCVDGRGGYIIASVARRIPDPFEIGAYKHYAKAIASKLMSDSCAAAPQLSEEMRAHLRSITASGDGE